MTKEQFDKLYFGKAVHCDTEEKANHFLALADSVGYKWNSGKSLIEKNGWETYEEETCYELTNDGLMYSNTTYFNRGSYKIIEYQLQPKFKVGDKVRVKDTVNPIVNGEIGVVEKIERPRSPEISLGAIAKDIHENAKKHGWWDEPKRSFGELIALCHSELSEALEEHRNQLSYTDIYYTKDKEGNDKPEGIPTELADAVIRIMDMCEYYGIDLEKAIIEKNEYNKKRPYKHGGKRI